MRECESACLRTHCILHCALLCKIFGDNVKEKEFEYVLVYLCKCMCMHMYVWACMGVYVCTCVFVCVFVCVCACVHARAATDHSYTHVHTHTNTHTNSLSLSLPTPPLIHSHSCGTFFILTNSRHVVSCMCVCASECVVLQRSMRPQHITTTHTSLFCTKAFILSQMKHSIYAF